MTQEHPITPPPELVTEWWDKCNALAPNLIGQFAAQAARWGADQELEACCTDIHAVYGKLRAEWLRSMRRPKTLSKKERALDSLLKCYAFIDDDLYNEIKEVIQSLPDEQ